MAEYSPDLKDFMDVFHVKTEIEDVEDTVTVQVEANHDDNLNNGISKDETEVSGHQEEEAPYILVDEDEEESPDNSLTNAMQEGDGSIMHDDSADIQAAFDAEPEDLSALGSGMDNSSDQDCVNDSVLYSVLSQGASPTRQQINDGLMKKRFDCRWCRASFTKKTSLRRHMNLHSGSRPFQCPFCEYNATRKDQLKTHIKTRHTRDSSKQFTFKCPLCSNLFQSQKRMTLHMRSHQWDNFPCDLCQIKFKSAHELVQHYKRRHPNSGSDPQNYPYVCNVCHRWCHSIEEYVDHIQTHPPKPYDMYDVTSDGDALESPAPSEKTGRFSILEQALSKGQPTSSRSRYPSDSSNGSQQRPGQVRPASVASASSSSPSAHHNLSLRPGMAPKNSLPSQSMLSTLLQDGRSASPSSNGPFISKTISLHDNRDIMKYPQNPVRNLSPLSSTFSARMPPNVVSPTRSRDSRESLEPHSPQLSSTSSFIRPMATNMVDSATQDDVMRCEHCHIIFADSIMYAIHMGCHDWKEPFRCNICAFRCSDRYEFMSHITRGLHQKK